ncbi:type II toxin-antitoxin system ParD family antitoxin (plasmid) [Sinorhizobium meliloti]|nr:type II toxin-antitoxin system ParD family antitoxin [Sinorhizobium meliloti]
MSLTAELESFGGGKVASGRYRSASEVVRAALCLLDRQSRHKGTGARKILSSTGSQAGDARWHVSRLPKARKR